MPKTEKKRQARSQSFIQFIQQWSTFHLSRLNIAAFRQEINSARREEGRGMNISSFMKRSSNQQSHSSSWVIFGLLDLSQLLGQQLISVTRISALLPIFSSHCIVGDKDASYSKRNMGFSDIFADSQRSFPGTIIEI